MKRRVTLSILILFFAYQASFSQEQNAILFDEFGALQCEDLSARLDNFFNEIITESNATGYIVIYAKEQALLENLRYESYIKGAVEEKDLNKYLKEKGFSKNRVQVIRGKEERNINIQLWKIPANSEYPPVSEAKWDYTFRSSTKPFIFTAYSYDGGPCPSTSYAKLFADFLKANPDVRGHLVIRDKSLKNISKKRTDILKELINQYKVSRNQIKLFYDKDKNYPYKFTDIEFWLVPRKNSK